MSERPGEGLPGLVAGKEIRVTSRQKFIAADPEASDTLPASAGGLECVILIDGEYAATYRLRDAPRNEGAMFVKHLSRRHGIERAVLLSGDRDSEVQYLANLVGISEYYGDQSPEDKLEFINRETARVNTMFVGDGINDAPALMAATVGIAFGQNSDVTTEATGVVIMDSSLAKVDDIKPVSSSMLLRVRGVPGVSWAVPLAKGFVRAKLPDGRYQQAILLGLDDGTYVGGPAPSQIVSGSLDLLGQPDAVFIDVRGAKQIWPDIENPVGMEIEMNDRRAKVVGLFEASRTFQTFPVVLTRFSRSLGYQPRERKTVTFILAGREPSTTPEECCETIQRTTGLQAQTRDQFIWTTIRYYAMRTGIPINFGITVVLGFIVGLAISGQTRRRIAKA